MYTKMWCSWCLQCFSIYYQFFNQITLILKWVFCKILMYFILNLTFSINGPNFVELLKLKILLNNFLLSINEQDTSQWYMLHGILAGNINLAMIMLMCLWNCHVKLDPRLSRPCIANRVNLGWTKTHWLEEDLNLQPLDQCNLPTELSSS